MMDSKEAANRIAEALPTFVPATDAEAFMMILLASPGFVNQTMKIEPISAVSRGQGMIAHVEMDGVRYRVQVDKVES